MTVPRTLAAAYLADILRTFRTYKKLADGSIAQIGDADLHRLVDPEANSIAIVMKHVAGNLRSRFTDFLTTDGEKPDRNRDGEFEDAAQSRDAIVADWNAGWAIALASIEALTPDDLERTVHIRREPFVVVEALNRSASHTAYHVGQIVLLAKAFAGSDWTTLTIPKGQSNQVGPGTYKQTR